MSTKALPYTTWTVGGVEYKLRLTSLGAVNFEKQYGSVYGIFSKFESQSLPELQLVLAAIQAAMQKYHPEMNLAKVYNLYDEYVDEGGDLTEMVTGPFMDIFRVSGFLPKEEETEATPETDETPGA